MELSRELISEFVKVTSNKSNTKQDSIVYGTAVLYDGIMYARLDGTDRLTPIKTTADVRDGERVTVMIKNHTATITGNLGSEGMSARVSDVETVSGKLSTFETILSNTVTTDQLSVQVARINTLESDNATIKSSLTSSQATIKSLQADNVIINETLTAANADIEYLKSNAITAKDVEGKYANIDFSNIGKAAMEYFYANSGLIKNVTVKDATITGQLSGVTISGDLIEANTVKAEKLVIKGSDGLYYKLNTDGATVESEQTDQNSLNGNVILAQSITASKINVDDLVAFDATIGGFNITENSLYSGVKESATNTTRGVYLDRDGQVSLGDATNYIKYYKVSDDAYKLDISANSVTMSRSGTNVETAISNLDTRITDLENIQFEYDSETGDLYIVTKEMA